LDKEYQEKFFKTSKFAKERFELVIGGVIGLYLE